MGRWEEKKTERGSVEERKVERIQAHVFVLVIVDTEEILGAEVELVGLELVEVGANLCVEARERGKVEYRGVVGKQVHWEGQEGSEDELKVRWGIQLNTVVWIWKILEGCKE